MVHETLHKCLPTAASSGTLFGSTEQAVEEHDDMLMISKILMHCHHVNCMILFGKSCKLLGTIDVPPISVVLNQAVTDSVSDTVGLARVLEMN